MLVKLSGLLSDVAGKVGGSVITRNHYGLYLKNWVTPYNPRTTYQMNPRVNFGNNVGLWQTITEDQRISWNLLASSIKWQNKLGQDYSPSGFDLFISCNQNRYMIGEAALEWAPAIPVLSQCSGSSIVYDPVTGDLAGDLSGGSIVPDIFYLFSVTKRMNPGRFYMTQNFANFGYLDDSTLHWDVTAVNYLVRWGLPFQLGYKYFLKIIPIHKPSGFSGIPYILYYIIPSGSSSYWHLGISHLDFTTTLN